MLGGGGLCVSGVGALVGGLLLTQMSKQGFYTPPPCTALVLQLFLFVSGTSRLNKDEGEV